MDQQDPALTVVKSAREAFERGDHIFQYTQSASLEDAYTGARYGRPFKAVQQLEIANQICREGWELVNGSVSRWESSRSVYMVGFYLYRRCAANRELTDTSVRQTVIVPTVTEAQVPSEPVHVAEAGQQDSPGPAVPGSPSISFPPPRDSGGRPRGRGWYPDPAAPSGQSQRRWWDGSVWTDRTDHL
jgi:hypothetical protein